MTYNYFERIFTNNLEYSKHKILYLDSLAYTVQEYLFTSKAEDRNCSFRMDDCIKLYDFMSLVVYFVEASISEFGKSTIKDYLKDIGVWRNGGRHQDSVEYHDQTMLVTDASNEMKTTLLWTTYIYAKLRSSREFDEKWNDASNMLFSLMKEVCDYPKPYFQELPPIKQTNEAVLFMLKHIEKKLKQKQQQTFTCKSEKQTIAEKHCLEEDKGLSENVENLKAQLAASNDRVKELEEALDKYRQEKEEMEDLTPEEQLAIDERIIFFSSAIGLDFDPKRTNQKQLATMISKLSGNQPTSIRGRISKMRRMEQSNAFSDGVMQAARNVKGLLEKVPQGNQPQKMKDIIANIDLVFLNTD